MKNRKDIIGAVGLILAIFTLIFGDNIYQQLMGYSVFQRPVVSAINEPTAISDPATHSPAFTPDFRVTPASNQVAIPKFESTEILDPMGVPMVLVPAGEFTMGQDGGRPDENPAHVVYLDAFYMDKYEVTNALYKACIEAGVCSTADNTDRYTTSSYLNHPVVSVTWQQAKTYCEWRGGKLPTEAQWEKAARGIEGRTYPWGESIDCGKANYGSCIGDTTPVGSYESGVSSYGIYDMTGNVSEWVADWYSATYYQNSLPSNPIGPNAGEQRVMRGGSWRVYQKYSYASVRTPWYPENTGNHDIGFRCSRVP